jgi:hypothetical protein
MVHLFEDCNLAAIHARRITISERFISRARRRGAALRPPLPGSCAALSSGHMPRQPVHALEAPTSADTPPPRPPLPRPAVPKDLQLARRIRGPVFGVSSF